jgi:hypothetical protein
MSVAIVEPGGGGDAQNLVKVTGGDPALAAEIQVHGGHASHALGDVQGFRAVAQGVFELLALGDVGDGADRTRGEAFGVIKDLATAGQPAQPAVQEEGAVLGLEFAAAGNGRIELRDHPFVVFGVDGGQPFVTREQGGAVGEAEEFEEQGRTGDLTGDEVQIEDAETAGGLRELEKFGGAAHLGLVLATPEDRLVQALREQLHLIAWRGVAGAAFAAPVDQERELVAQALDALRKGIRGEPRGGEQEEEARAETHGQDEVTLKDRAAGVILVAGADQPEAGEGRQQDRQNRYCQQFAANWPTTHATSRPGGRAPQTTVYRPAARPLEL